MSGSMVGRLWRGRMRSAGSAVAGLAVIAGMLVSADSPAARAVPAGAAAGTGLPSPGPLLPAPTSLVAAGKEMAPVLAQTQNPKTALLGTVRLLVNSGVSILNGPKTVFRGRRGGPPMFLQAGAVVSLSQDITGPGVTLSGLLKIYAAANLKGYKMGLTAGFFGRNFAAEISGASDASEYLWAAALTGADTSAKGLVTSLKGVGTPPDAIAPVQVELLSLRLRVDALATASAFKPKHAKNARLARPAAVGKDPPCNIDSIPEWLNGIVTSGYNHGIDATIKHGGFGDLAEKYAQRYGIASSLFSIAGTVINLLVLMFAMDAKTTPKPDPMKRTTSTSSNGAEAIISTSFSWPTENWEWLNCARIILNLTGFDGSVPGKIIKGAEVTWSLDSDSSAAAKLINDSAKTNDEGIARTVITGLAQPYDLGQPVPYIRKLGLTASINPRSARSAGDLLFTDCLTAIEGILGTLSGTPAGVLAGIDAILKLAVSLAEELGILRHATPINMLDHYQFPTAVSATFTFSNASTDEPWETMSATGTIPRTAISEKDGQSDFTQQYPIQGSVQLSGGCPASATPTGSPTYGSVIVYAIPALRKLFGEAAGVAITTSYVTCPYPYPTEGFASSLQTGNTGNTNLWFPQAATTTSTLQDPLTQAVVGSITFHWYYTKN